jgi:hypothetical protein
MPRSSVAPEDPAVRNRSGPGRVWHALVSGLLLAGCSSPEVVKSDIGRLNAAPSCCRDLAEVGRSSRSAFSDAGSLNESSPHFEFPSGKSPFLLLDLPAGTGARTLDIRQRSGESVMIDGSPQLKYLPVKAWFVDATGGLIQPAQGELHLKQFSMLSANRLVRSVPIPPDARAAILFDDGALLNRTVAIPLDVPELAVAIPKAVVFLPGHKATLTTLMVPYGSFELVILDDDTAPAPEHR